MLLSFHPKLLFNEFINDISVYPNPSSGLVVFKLKNSTSNKTIVSVYDLQGKKVIENEIPYIGEVPVLLNLSGLANGMYIIKITDQNKTYNTKVIIEK